MKQIKQSKQTKMAAWLPLVFAGAVAAPVHALENGNVLSIGAGSFFTMNGATTDDFVPGYEGQFISGFNGLILGAVQPATGSHGGDPDGTELPNIDDPWMFFFNTGMHLTTVPVTVINQTGGQVELDFNGWAVGWNGIEIIPLGAGAWAGNPEGIAQMSCALDCSIGDSYTLAYSGTIPDGDPSNFGGVTYYLFLEGSIVDPASTVNLEVTAVGGAAQECADAGGHVVDFTSTATVPDDLAISSITWFLDGTEIGSGDSISAFVDLGDHVMSATMLLTDGQSATGSTRIDIGDTTSPSLAPSLDRSGNALVANFNITDICDPAPTSQAVVGAPVDEGEEFVVQPATGGVRFTTTELELMVTGTDASGNSASATILRGLP